MIAERVEDSRTSGTGNCERRRASNIPLWPASVFHIADTPVDNASKLVLNELQDSSRVLALERIRRSIHLVIVCDGVFSTPRITMHKQLLLTTTATPCGCSTSASASATCFVSRFLYLEPAREHTGDTRELRKVYNSSVRNVANTYLVSVSAI